MLTWQQRLNSIAARIGEPDLFDNASNTELGTPYFDPVVTEQWLYQSCLFFLRRIPPAELGAIGSAALLTITASPVPLGQLKYISAVIDGKSAELVDPKTYLAMTTAAIAGMTSIYTVIGSNIQFGGSAISITALIEPPLSAFQADMPIMPPGYDEDAINRTKSYLMISDYLPQGRL